MEELSRKLEGLLAQASEAGQIAGGNVLILQDGKEAAYAQAGYADKEADIFYQRDAIVRLYSMTKPVTVAAAALLVERGVLDLAESVENYLPGFHNAVVAEEGGLVPAKRPVRIYDLLHMTSGLSYGGDETSPSSVEAQKLFDRMGEALGTEHEMGTIEVANRMGLCPLAFHPGEKWLYGTSADVMGAVIEAVSGMRFGEFLRKEFFEPLGMKDTDFYVPKEKQGRLVKVYEKTPEGLVCYRGNHLAIKNSGDTPPAFESGGAGLFSTLDDYAQFAEMLLGQGSYKGKQILQPQTVRSLTGGKLMPWQQKVLENTWDGLSGYTYGNFMRVAAEPAWTLMRTSVGEYGWDGWLGAYFCNSPADRLTMLLTIQLKDAGTTELTRRIKNVVWSSLCQ